MKNLLKILSALLLVVTFSCDESDGRFVDNPESGWVQFEISSANFTNDDLIEDQTTSLEIAVVLTAPINKSDLMVTYDIVDVEGNSSTIISAGNSVVFPANTNIVLDPLVLTFNLEEIENNITTPYVFDVVLTGTNNSNVKVGITGDDSFATSFRVTIAPCEAPASGLGGMYSVTTVYGFHDFLPDFDSNTMDMEIVDNGDGTYFVQDFSGGLYDGGPYTAAYGTGATSIDVTFSNDGCVILWDGQVDPWGDVIPLLGGTNAYDPDTGAITISWFCTGYGENGVSVYTPN